jgi:hypothetical protein
MKKAILIFMTLIGCVFVSGCNFRNEYVNEDSEKQKAEKIADKLYAYIAKQDYKNAEELFGKAFFKATTKEGLQEIFQQTHKQLGAYESGKIIEWKTRRVVGTDLSSAEYLLVYEVKYKKFTAKETISLVKEEDDVIRILSYYVNSEGFLKE